MVKILAWNILHGGGPQRMPRIALAVVEHAPDVAVLTEFRTTTGGQIRGTLADHGWTHQVCTDPPRGCNGILIASRTPIRPGPLAQRSAAADVPALGLRLLAVHIPCDGPGQARPRAEAWQALLRAAREGRDEPLAIVGDFNTGRHRLDETGATFSHTASLGRLASLGFSDAWRARNPQGRDASWVSHAGNGLRIDHAYLSRVLVPRLRDAWYSHRERELRISDHSALIVTLDAGGGGAGTPHPSAASVFSADFCGFCPRAT